MILIFPRFQIGLVNTGGLRGKLMADSPGSGRPVGKTASISVQDRVGLGIYSLIEGAEAC